jgi:DNA-binding transcriptional LysR family regulator
MIALVKAGIGYAVVPEWIIGPNDDDIEKMAIDDLQKVKVYFGCSSFLERDPLILEFREICRQEMSGAFSTHEAKPA